MKKRKINVEIMIIVALVALLAGYKLLDATSYRFVEAKAVHYLCQKYDAQPENFELVDYKRAQIYWDDYYIFFLIVLGFSMLLRMVFILKYLNVNSHQFLSKIFGAFWIDIFIYLQFSFLYEKGMFMTNNIS